MVFSLSSRLVDACLHGANGSSLKAVTEQFPKHKHFSNLCFFKFAIISLSKTSVMGLILSVNS